MASGREWFNTAKTWNNTYRLKLGRGKFGVALRQPLYFAIIAALIIGIIAPVSAYLIAEARYRVIGPRAEVIALASPNLSSKFSFDSAKKATVFNADGELNYKDKLISNTGGGGKNSTQLYTATMPERAASGITVRDNVNATSVTFTPLFATDAGKRRGERVIYPLAGLPGKMIYTPKANGLKEDILLERASADEMSFSYQLSLPDSLQAKLLSDGRVGIFSGDPALFGNITYGSAADQAKVELARRNADKTYLMFAIPPPTVKQSGRGGGVKAWFSLNGNTLKVTASGLKRAAFPLSIDPTFVVTSSQDFNLGRAEDNIDFSVNGQIGRAAITGGKLATAGWQTGPNITACTTTGTDSNFGLTAYNGFLYLAGGGGGSNTYTCYTSIDPITGALGTWTAATNQFVNGRTGAGVVGYNGYIYVMGGENANGGTQYNIVEYSKVQANGDLGVWATTSPLITGRAYSGAAVYGGYVYALGGSTARNNGKLVNTTEYAKINSDGTLGAFANSTAFTTARDRFGVATYNNYIYIGGGYSGSPLSDVEYAPLNVDGTIGAWAATTAYPGTRRSHAMSVERGYLYAYGGCSTGFACSGLLASTIYAPVHADGTVGAWDTSANLPSARFYNGGASYNGFVYNVAGCTVEPTNNNNCTTELGDSQYATLSAPGGVAVPVADSALTTARASASTFAYNGYLYSAGGCNGTSCGSYASTVEYTAINDSGTIGTWATTGALPAATGMAAGRSGGTLTGIGGKLFYIGGIEKTTGGVDNYANTVFSATPLANGTIGSWATETATFTNGREYHGTTLWNNYIYIVGGKNATTYYGDVQYTQVVNGVLTAPSGCASVWCTATSALATARGAAGVVAYDGNLYVIGGTNSTTAYLADVQRAPITATGNITGGFFTDAALPAGRSYLTAVGHNSQLYIYGGMTAAAATADILFAPLVGTASTVGSWTTSTRTLITARWSASAAAYNGRVYIASGCTSSGPPPCTAYTANVESILVNNGGTGQTSQIDGGAWTSQATPALTARADFAYAYNSGYLYALGGCTAYTSGVCSSWDNTAYYAPVNSDGSVGTWATTTPLPEARAQSSANIFNGYIYVVGGSTGPTALTTNKVIYAPINVNGTIGSWVDSTANYLPIGLSSFGSAVSSQYLYIAGGYDGTTRKNQVLYTYLGTSGAPSAPGCATPSGIWCTSASTFTTGRQDLNVWVYNSALYVVGGYDGSNTLGDIQFAPLNATNGSLGTFGFTTYDDGNARARGIVASDGYMYFLGNERSGNSVQYTGINANATLGNLYQASSAGMISTSNHSHGGYAIIDGYMYAYGGCTLSAGSCTTVNNGVDYTGVKATPRLAHYSKLFNTQVDTSPTQLSVGGALSSGSSTVITSLQTASSSDPVFGVAQVFNPTIFGNVYPIKALNSSGQNVGVAFSYLVKLTLDDSQSGAFPDTSISTSTNITDFTLYYHANPSRRLRHGASFTNTDCNAIPSNGCILDTAQ